jgi:hypothetical protein
MSGTFVGPDRRRVMRVDVPHHLRKGELEPHFVHLLNLSPLGVRVTHLEPWGKGVGCSVDLPPALGAIRLSGRVVWTRLRGTEQTLAGDRRDHYESGIEFTHLTPAQEKALADVLATLQAAQGGLGDPALPSDTPPPGNHGASS